MLRSVTMLASSSCCTPSTLSCSIQSNRAGEGEKGRENLGEGEGEEEGEGVAVREKGEEEGGGVRGGREDRVNWMHVPPHTVSGFIAHTKWLPYLQKGLQSDSFCSQSGRALILECVCVCL